MTRRAQALVQRGLVLTHLLGLSLFLGGTAGVLLLAHGGEHLAGGAHRAFAFEVAGRLQDLVLLPGALALALSGLTLSLVGPHGFFKHWWLVAKLVASVILTFHSQVEYRPSTFRLLELARAEALPPEWPDVFFHFQRVGVIQLAVLAVVGALGVFKPWGKTKLGRRTAAQAELPQASAAKEP